jgi:hypothetical protein
MGKKKKVAAGVGAALIAVGSIVTLGLLKKKKNKEKEKESEE